MAGPQRPASPLASSLDTLRRQFGMGRASTLEILADRWGELAPEGAAARSWVVDLRGGVLTVDADDSATAEVLSWSKQRLLSGVRDACPGEVVVDLTVRVRRRPRP